jgi:hypothetical protein
MAFDIVTPNGVFMVEKQYKRKKLAKCQIGISTMW